jgi:hypothetical protein
MENKELNQMIRAALGWAGYVNGKQGLLDISYAMGLDETHCSGCEEFNPHFENCCVVCGQHNEKNKPNKMNKEQALAIIADNIPSISEDLSGAIAYILISEARKEVALNSVLLTLNLPDSEDDVEWEMDGADINEIEFICKQALQ